MTNNMFRSCFRPMSCLYRSCGGPKTVLGLCVTNWCDPFEDEVAYPSDEG